MRIKQLRMHLISYGRSAFDSVRFKPIRNIPSFVKPDGGLWASPIDSEYGWAKWCRRENFGDLSCFFTFWYTGNVFEIDSLSDANKMPWQETNQGRCPDFEEMVRTGIDAIWLTVKGERDTRWRRDHSLYSWDCESVLIMNPNGVTSDKEE